MSTPLRERPDAPLGTLIFRAGLLPAETIESALEEGVKTGKRLGEILTERGLISEVDLARLLAGQKGLDFVTLREQIVDPSAAALFTEEQARLFRALPYSFDGDLPIVAIADPTDDVLIRNIREALGREDARFVVTARGELAEIAADVYSKPFQPAPPPPPSPEVSPEAAHANGHAQADAELAIEPPPAADPLPAAPRARGRGRAEAALTAEPVLEVAPAPDAGVDIEVEAEAPHADALEPEPAAFQVPVEAPVDAENAVSEPAPAPQPEPEPLAAVEPSPPVEQSLPLESAPAPETLAAEPAVDGPVAAEATVQPEPIAAPERPSAPSPPPIPSPRRSPRHLHSPSPCWSRGRSRIRSRSRNRRAPSPSRPSPSHSHSRLRCRRRAVSSGGRATRSGAGARPEQPSVPVVVEGEAPEPAGPVGADTPWRMTIRLTNGDRVDAGEFADETSAKQEAKAIMMQIAAADQDDWPFVNGRFLKPDTIVSVDIAEDDGSEN